MGECAPGQKVGFGEQLADQDVIVGVIDADVAVGQVFNTADGFGQ